ncbi:MAG: hypothetical protein U0271_41755 [Polyangiaceae bacterium]
MPTPTSLHRGVAWAAVALLVCAASCGDSAPPAPGATSSNKSPGKSPTVELFARPTSSASAPAREPPSRVAKPRATDFEWLAPTPFAYELLDVAVTAKGRFIAVGDRGNIVHSDDDGKTWVDAGTLGRGALSSICTLGSGRVLVAGLGGDIWYSDDEAESFTRVSVAGTARLRAVACASATAIAVGQLGTVLRTTDGGVTWTHASGVPRDVDLLGVSYFDDKTVVVTGAQGVALSSSDGGDSFTVLKDLMPESRPGIVGYASDLFAASKGADGVVVLTGADGTVLTAPKLGDKFTYLYDKGSSFTTFGDGIAMPDGSLLVASSNGLGRLSLADGKFTPESLPSMRAIRALAKKGEVIVGVGEAGAIVRLSGKNPEASWAGSAPSWRAVVRQGDNLFAVGESGLVLSSRDMGKTFSYGDTGDPSALRAACVLGPKEVLLAGEQGLAFSTSDGLAFALENTHVEVAINGLSAADNVVFAVGDKGTILRRDGKDKWVKLDGGVDKNLAAVWARTKSEVYVAGDRGTLLRTTDGGATWAKLDARGSQALTAIAGQASLVAVVGEGGTVLVSTDGTTFARRPAPELGALSTVAVTASGTIVVGGKSDIAASVKDGTFESRGTFGGAFFASTLLTDGSVVLVGEKGAVVRLPPAKL